MGILGVAISICIIAFVAWYGYFGGTGGSFVVENSGNPPIVEELLRAEDIIGQTNDLKSVLERRVEETVREAEGTGNQETAPLSVSQATDSEFLGISVTDRLMTSGFAPMKEGRAIDTIVLHSSYDAIGKDPYAVEGLVKEYEAYGVSAHYLIDRKGNIYRLVKDKDVAYHAGVAKMPDGRRNVNDFSIGIELMNREDTEYAEVQYEALNNLIAALRKTYPIKSVVGHSDIAPGRKTDPWNFDWKKLK